MTPLVAVSIVVPCRNAGSHFRPLLESLVSQALDEPAEIVVVDNGSTDDSRSIAETVMGRVPVRVVTAPDRANASYACNVGAHVAVADKLLFVDADDEVAPGYVAAMSSALNAHDFVTSRVDSATLNADWLRAAHGPPWQADGVTCLFDFLPAAGVNIGIRRSLYKRIGGFSEDFAASQDIVLSWSVQQAGVSIHFVPDAIYRYRYRDTVRSLYRQSRNWGRSNVLLYRRFRADGMPGRSVRLAAREWADVLSQLAMARGKRDLAPLAVRLGYCVGRMQGSIRHQVLYL